MNNTTGKATSRLIPHRCNVDAVNTAARPFATHVLTDVTIPVIGNTNKKL
jgi:hypothetical protein